MKRLTRDLVSKLPPAEQTALYFSEHIGTGSKGPTLELRAQQAWWNNPRETIELWIWRLPR